MNRSVSNGLRTNGSTPSRPLRLLPVASIVLAICVTLVVGGVRQNSRGVSADVVSCPLDFPARVLVTTGTEPPGDPVFDAECNFLYVPNLGANAVEVFDLRKQERLDPIAVGVEPTSADISVDGSRLYVTNRREHTLSVVDLITRSEVARIVVTPLDSTETPHSIAVLDATKALVTSTWPGSGFAAHLYEVDLLAGTSTVRTDLSPFSGAVDEQTYVYRSPNRAFVVIAGRGSNPAFIGLYSSATNAFRTVLVDESHGYAGVVDSGDPVLISAYQAFVFDSLLGLKGTIPGSSFALVPSPDGRLAYRVLSGFMEVLDVEGLQSTGRLIALGDSMNTYFSRTRIGALALSRDGGLAAIVTDHGVSILRTDEATPTPTSTSTPTATETPTATPTPSPCARADFNDDGRVSHLDIAVLAQHFGGKPYDARYDLNYDGLVDVRDLRIAVGCMR